MQTKTKKPLDLLGIENVFFFLINCVFRQPNLQRAIIIGLLGILLAEPADETWWKLSTSEQSIFFSYRRYNAKITYMLVVHFSPPAPQAEYCLQAAAVQFFLQNTHKLKNLFTLDQKKKNWVSVKKHLTIWSRCFHLQSTTQTPLLIYPA